MWTDLLPLNVTNIQFNELGNLELVALKIASSKSEMMVSGCSFFPGSCGKIRLDGNNIKRPTQVILRTVVFILLKKKQVK